MGKRIGAVIFIFICTSVAWLCLGGITQFRSEQQNVRLGQEVEGLWGSPHRGETPNVELRWKEREQRPMNEAEKNAFTSQQYELAKTKADLLGVSDGVPEITEEQLQIVNIKERRESGRVVASQVKVDLKLEHRQKGLLWFPTYTVEFSGEYQVMNSESHAADVTVRVPFPAINAVYENLILTLQQPSDDFAYVVRDRAFWATMKLEPGEIRTLILSYNSRGLDTWAYSFNTKDQMVRDFDLTMTTDFNDIDFPSGSISPDGKVKRSDGPGWVLSWQKGTMVTTAQLGMVMPRKLDPGPLAAQMSMTAPISLLFLFFVLFMLQVVRGYRLHYMNYFFVAASMFAFNLLFSYLAGVVNIYAAFTVASLVSLGLVVTYLHTVIGDGFARYEAAGLQLVFQIMLGVAHLLQGNTGLTVTVCAVLTLGLTMYLTANIDWDEVFSQDKATAPQPTPPPPEVTY